MEGGYDARRVLANVGVYTRTRISPGETLVILDEIQEAGEALPLMKAFAEDAPEYHVATAGSYLGIAYHAKESFPVGKVHMMDMHPASFLEFLDAAGEPELGRMLRHQEFVDLAPSEGRLRRLLREYLFVGACLGRSWSTMWAMVTSKLPATCRKRSLHSTTGLFEASGPSRSREDSPRARLHPSASGPREPQVCVWAHCQRRPCAGIRHGDPVDGGLGARHARISRGQVREAAEICRDLSAFKLCLPDVGLLGAAMEVDATDVLLSNAGLEEYKGALAEQCVCQ